MIYIFFGVYYYFNESISYIKRGEIMTIFRFSLSALMVFSIGAIAQQEGPTIEEVVVTVTKKEESVQDIPVSIQAFGADQLEARQVFDMQGLSQNVPGFVHSKAIGSGASYSIRGYGSFGVGAATISSYVTATNGHSVNNGIFSDIGFFDVDRVEVLKGPQGTLFGRNAVGGVINQITTRPGDEFGGYARVKVGNYDLRKVDTAIDIPLSDRLKTRVAVSSLQRGGWVTNLHTNNEVDDRDQQAVRFSVDYDLSDTSSLSLTYEQQKGKDSRFNIGQIYCAKDPLLGCDPYQLGDLGQPMHKAGAFTGAFNLIAAITPTPTFDSYAGAVINSNIDVVNHNVDPYYEQTAENTSIIYLKEMSHGTFKAQATYNTRDYYHHQDNEYGVAKAAGLPGLLAGLLPPIGFEATFYGFNEYVTWDRQYEFSDAKQNGHQWELNYVSDFDGPLNFTVGYYKQEADASNIYLIQSAALQMIADVGRHPYNDLVFAGALNDLRLAGQYGLGPAAWANLPTSFAGYGGVSWYTNLVLGLGAGGLGAIPTLFPALAAMPKYTLPHEMQGYFQDSHNTSKSSAIYGELYYDVNEKTKITLGFRMDDFEVFDSQFSCLGDNGAGCELFRDNYATAPEYVRYPAILQGTKSDDTSGKFAIQRYIAEDAMIYFSFTEGAKSGGSNPNEKGIPDPYLPEAVEYIEFGLKGRFMGGRLSANVNYFSGEHSNMIISSITDAGSRNVNFDATIEGFEGEISFLLTDSTRIDFNFLDVTSEVDGTAMLVDPLNIVLGTKRVPIPAGALPWGDAGQMVSVVPGSSGLMQVGWTDAGPVFKFAGYSCNTSSFNPLTGNYCTTALAQDVGGNTLPGAPDFSYNFAITQSIATANGMIDVRLSQSFMGKRWGDIFNNPALRIDDSSTMDLNITYVPNDGDWYVGLWGRNLEDDRSIQGIYKASNLQGGSKFANHNEPATYGVQFGYNF